MYVCMYVCIYIYIYVFLLPAAISVSKFSRVEASPGAIKLSKPNGTMWLGAVGHILDVLTLRSAVAAADDAASEPQLDATQPHRHLENKKATQPVSATATAAAGCDPKYAPGGCNYFPKYRPTPEETAFQKMYWNGRRDEWGSSPTCHPTNPWLSRSLDALRELGDCRIQHAPTLFLFFILATDCIAKVSRTLVSMAI